MPSHENPKRAMVTLRGLDQECLISVSFVHPAPGLAAEARF
jgi:hypothetical protein